MKSIRVSVRASIFVLLCALSTLARAETPNLNYLVVNGISAPFQIASENASNGGIITEIVEALASRAGYTLTTTIGSVERIDTIIKYGQQQPWIAYTAKVWPYLKEHFNYLEVPLFEVQHSLLTCDPQMQTIDGTTTLLGKHFAILKGFDYPEIMRLASQGELEITTVRNYQQGFDLVQYQRVNGFVEMDIRAKYNLGKYNRQDPCLHFADLGRVIPPYHIYLAVSRDVSRAQTLKLETELEALIKEGFVADVIERHTQH